MSKKIIGFVGVLVLLAVTAVFFSFKKMPGESKSTHIIRVYKGSLLNWARQSSLSPRILIIDENMTSSTVSLTAESTSKEIFSPIEENLKAVNKVLANELAKGYRIVGVSAIKHLDFDVHEYILEKE